MKKRLILSLMLLFAAAPAFAQPASCVQILGDFSHPIGIARGITSCRVGGQAGYCVSDITSSRVNFWNPASYISLAGTGVYGFSGDNGPATLAALNGPQSTAFNPDTDTIYVADQLNTRIRQVNAIGIINTTVNEGLGVMTSAVVRSRDGSLMWTRPQQNQVVRYSGGLVKVIAGKGGWGHAGDGGPAIAATLASPWALSETADGSLYVSDYGMNYIRRIAPDGTITTVAGTGWMKSEGDGGFATSTALAQPMGLSVAPGGDIYIGESGTSKPWALRRIRGGIIDTVSLWPNPLQTVWAESDTVQWVSMQGSVWRCGDAVAPVPTPTAPIPTPTRTASATGIPATATTPPTAKPTNSPVPTPTAPPTPAPPRACPPPPPEGCIPSGVLRPS